MPPTLPAERRFTITSVPDHHALVIDYHAGFNLIDHMADLKVEMYPALTDLILAVPPGVPTALIHNLDPAYRPSLHEFRYGAVNWFNDRMDDEVEARRGPVRTYIIVSNERIRYGLRAITTLLLAFAPGLEMFDTLDAALTAARHAGDA